MLYEKVISLKGSDASQIFAILMADGEETALRFLEDKYCNHKSNGTADKQPWPITYKVYSDDSPFIIAYGDDECILARVIISGTYHTPLPWTEVEALPHGKGLYRVKEAAFEHFEVTTEPERMVVDRHHDGNARLIKAACNIVMKIAQELQANPLALAELVASANHDRGMAMIAEGMKAIINDLRGKDSDANVFSTSSRENPEAY